jgi:hypothetical protein
VTLREYVQNWIGRLSQPRPEFGGLRPCPYAQTAKLICLSVEHLKDALSLAMLLRGIPERTVVIIELPRAGGRPRDMRDLKRALAVRNIVPLLSDPDRPVSVAGFQTSQSERLLLLLQRKDELEKLSAQLDKTAYYEQFSSETLAELR